MGDKEKRRRRRNDLDRMKRKAKEIFWWWPNAIKWANHLKGCSCWMCRNLRENEGPTRQERLKDDLDDRMSD